MRNGVNDGVLPVFLFENLAIVVQYRVGRQTVARLHVDDLADVGRHRFARLVLPVGDLPLDESPLIFEPSKYVNQLKQHWSKYDGNASYALLTRCFVLVSGTASRIKIVDTLVNCLRILIEGDPETQVKELLRLLHEEAKVI